MAPRAEFILASMLAATGLLVAVVLLLDIDRRMPDLADLLASLKLVPAAWLATGLGAWCVTRWHGRALQLGRRWAPGGMTLRTLLVVFLLFPLALAAWLLVATAVDQITAASPGRWRESLAWLPVIVFYGSMIAVVFGAVPAFILEYFASRRYLRRLTGNTTGQS